MIKKIKKDVLMMTVHIGTGESPDGTKFEMMTSTSGMMMVKFEDKDKSQYMIGWEEFIKKCDKLRLTKK